jgi:2-polyprenyl-3-methyl-5-hydroxy-6-metoxy-1,4-benzoquinol methylase
MIDLSSRPNLKALVTDQLEFWPEHERYLSRSLESRDEQLLDVSEDVSGLILRIARNTSEDLSVWWRDYKYLCEDVVLPEELFFRRHGKYRLSTFEDANRECYANAAMMGRYMNGLLLSSVFWENHARALSYYALKFLPRLAAGARHLEIGPGHGLQLYLAARHPNVGSATGWDISPTSIEKTRAALESMEVADLVALELRDLFAPKNHGDLGRFDSVVLSEILEHLEDPVAALCSVAEVIPPGGHLWVNVPANSPAPDHIFLFESLEHAEDIVEQAGFRVLDSEAYAMSGASLERAAKHKLSISCVIAAQRPE